MNSSSQPSDPSPQPPEKFDAWVAERLRATRPPADLRAALDFGRLTTPRKTRRSFRGFISLAGAAAALVLAALYGVDEYTDRREFGREADFRSAMAAYISEVEFKLDYKSENLGTLLQYIRPVQSIGPEEIPVGLRTRIPKGCKEIGWGKYTVALICFYEGKPGGRLVHMFVIDKRDVPAQATASLRQTLRRSTLETAGWETDQHAFILVAGHPNLSLAPIL